MEFLNILKISINNKIINAILIRLRTYIKHSIELCNSCKHFQKFLPNHSYFDEGLDFCVQRYMKAGYNEAHVKHRYRETSCTQIKTIQKTYKNHCDF